MIPDDALDRLLEGCQSIAKQCEAQGIQEWEIVASQGYGRSLDIEAGRISLASGGGEGGFGVESCKTVAMAMRTSWTQVEPSMQSPKHSPLRKQAHRSRVFHFQMPWMHHPLKV